MGHFTKHSDETKQKMRLAKLGKRPSKETLEKRSISLKKVVRTEEWKKKISIAHKGKKLSKEHIANLRKAKLGVVSPLKGTHKTAEERARMNLSGLVHNSGPDSHLWKGGITSENNRIRGGSDGRNFIKICMQRDNFTCQKCGNYGGKLNVHHINNFADYPELRTTIDNGITLCRICHMHFHKIYNKRNNTLEQLQEFLDYN